MGPDKIRGRVLKELPGVVAGSLSTITTGLGVWRNPSHMIAANIVSVFKKGLYDSVKTKMKKEALSTLTFSIFSDTSLFGTSPPKNSLSFYFSDHNSM